MASKQEQLTKAERDIKEAQERARKLRKEIKKQEAREKREQEKKEREQLQAQRIEAGTFFVDVLFPWLNSKGISSTDEYGNSTKRSVFEWFIEENPNSEIPNFLIEEDEEESEPQNGSDDSTDSNEDY